MTDTLDPIFLRRVESRLASAGQAERERALEDLLGMAARGPGWAHSAAEMGLPLACAALASRAHSLDALGHTPLMVAVLSARPSCVAALIPFSDIEARSPPGRSALLLGAMLGGCDPGSAMAASRLECAMALLRAGADPNSRPLGGRGALRWACDRLDGPLAEALLAAGADPLAADSDGRAPLDALRDALEPSPEGSPAQGLRPAERACLERALLAMEHPAGLAARSAAL